MSRAGVDQFGGEHRPDLVVELVRSGRAEEVVGSAALRALGAAARRRSLTVPKNPEQSLGAAEQPRRVEDAAGSSLLPLAGRPRLHVEGVDPATAEAYADVVADPAEAELAPIRLGTPSETRTGLFESFFHAGRLDFPEDRPKEVLDLLAAVPTVVALHLEWPAVVPEIAEHCAALVADYGASDAALLDVLFGRAEPEGRLPFQLPRSMAEVETGRPDVPREGADPLIPFGFGLRLAAEGWFSGTQSRPACAATNARRMSSRYLRAEGSSRVA